MSQPAVAEGPLVGRRLELGRLRELLTAARDGRGCVAVVRGEAGIGKTRLVAEVTGEAVASGAVVRGSEAGELEQTRPFGAIADALGASAAAADPRLAELARLLRHPPSAPGSLEEAPVELQYLVEIVVEVFESLCSPGPLVLVVDNLHWADDGTLATLQRLLRLCPQYPALVLAAARPTDRPEVESVVVAADRGGGVVDLGPLDVPSVRRLAGSVVGGRPGPRLGQELEKAAGNPLLVVELASALRRRGLVAATPTGLVEVSDAAGPVGVDAAVLHRLGLLPADTVSLLRYAAILGQVIEVEELSLLAGRSPLELAEPLRAAVRAGVLEAGGDRLSFRHDLVQDALYRDWPHPVRTEMHKTLGGLMAASGAPAPRVAYHLGLGAEPGDVEAVRWLRRAGREIAPRAPRTGAGLLGRAVELARPDDPSYDAMRTDLAVALVWAGRVDDGERVAGAVAAETSDPDVRGRAAWWLASSLLNRGRVAEAGELCTAALAARVGSDAVRILLLLTAAIAGVPFGDQPAGTVGLEELLAEARRLGDPGVRCRCLVGLMMAEANGARLEAAATHGDEALRDAESLAPAEMVVAPAHVCWAWLLEEQDRLDEAIEVVERLGRLAGPLPRSASLRLHDTSTGRAHFAAGRWDVALVDLDSVLSWEYTGTGSWADALAFRAAIAVHRGELARAEEDLDRVAAEVAAGGACFAVDHLTLARAFLLEAQGQVGPAAEVAAAAWQLARDLPLAMVKPTIGPHLARWSAATGDPGTARRVAADLGEIADQNPGVTRLRAVARWAAGIAGSDPDVLLEAVALHRRGPRPLDRGLACEDAAAALAAAGRVAEARELFHEALDHYDRLLAAQRAASARARLRALGVRAGVRGPRRRPRTGWEALTETEARIVGLVAEHLSNPEIAERLVVSRRTVETHVSHALAKLGCVSRRELAAAFGRHAGRDHPSGRHGPDG